MDSKENQPTLQSSRTRIRIAATTIALSVAAAGWLYYVTTGQVPPNGGLVVDKQFLDFGEVQESPNFNWVVAVENPTNKAIIVERLVGSCSCLEIEPNSLAIPSGGREEIKLTLDLRASNSSEAEKLSREFTVAVTPFIEGVVATQKSWELKGRVHRLLIVSPPTINCGEVNANEISLPHVVIVSSSKEIEELTTECKCPWAKVEVERLSSQVNTFKISVVLTNGMPGKHFDFPVRLICKTSVSGEVLKGEFKVEGTILQDIYVTPRFLAFGPRHVGDCGDEVVVLRARSGQPFSIIDVNGADRNMKVFRENDEAKHENRFRVSTQFSELGHQEKVIRFSARVGSTVVEIPLQVSYHGTK